MNICKSDIIRCVEPSAYHRSLPAEDASLPMHHTSMPPTKDRRQTVAPWRLQGCPVGLLPILSNRLHTRVCLPPTQLPPGQIASQPPLSKDGLSRQSARGTGQPQPRRVRIQLVRWLLAEVRCQRQGPAHPPKGPGVLLCSTKLSLTNSTPPGVRLDESGIATTSYKVRQISRGC